MNFSRFGKQSGDHAIILGCCKRCHHLLLTCSMGLWRRVQVTLKTTSFERVDLRMIQCLGRSELRKIGTFLIHWSKIIGRMAAGRWRTNERTSISSFEITSIWEGSWKSRSTWISTWNRWTIPVRRSTWIRWFLILWWNQWWNWRRCRMSLTPWRHEVGRVIVVHSPIRRRSERKLTTLHCRAGFHVSIVR
jgi:hypothetical protein